MSSFRRFAIRVRAFYSRVAQGKMFENMLRNALKDLAEREGGGFWWQRIFDYRSFVAVNPKIVAFKQPADFMGCWHGRYLLVECKSTTLTSFRLDNFKPHQEQAMKDLTAAGGLYWLLILHRHKGERGHECYGFLLNDWNHLKKKAADGGKFSANWNEVEDFCTIQLSRRGGVWDLKPLMEES
jgi:recombination protein U